MDYKIATKTITLRIEKVLPHLINPTQTGYVKGRFIGEGIRLMEYTKYKDIPGVAVLLDFEKAFDSVEWNYIQKFLEATNFGRILALISASRFMFFIIISPVGL